MIPLAGPLAAWTVGWVICLVAIVTTAYDGCATLVFGPIAAAVCSGFVVGAAWLLGLALFRSPAIAGLWRRGRTWSALAALGCLAVMAFGSSMGLTDVYTDPDSGRQFVGLHPAAAATTYFLILFVVANWPVDGPKLR